MRTKKKTLFNKNHVSLEVFLDEKNAHMYIEHFKDYSGEASKRVGEMKKTVIRAKSPLGFYYDKTVYEDDYAYTKSTAIEKHTYSFYLPDKHYVLTFYVSYMGTHVSYEQRPWEIADNVSIGEHYIFDLLKEIDNIYLEMNSVKKKNLYELPDTEDTNRWGMYGSRYNKYKYNDSTIKSNLYKDLFGDAKGPKFQTNDEKILSHGFDLKTSFRKM